MINLASILRRTYPRSALQSRDALCCVASRRVASRRVASRRGLSDPKIHSLPTSNFTTTALDVDEEYVGNGFGEKPQFTHLQI